MSAKILSSSWTPVDLTRNIRKQNKVPRQVQIHDQKYAIYWQGGKSRISSDVCKHRGASLSAGGQILDSGCLKCKYHGHATKPLEDGAIERDGILWMRTGFGDLPEDESEPPTSWEFDVGQDLRIFDYTRSFKGCNPILTVENTLDFSHLDTVHLFHLIEGRPDVSFERRGYNGKAIYKYKSKVFRLAIENEYLGPWSSCLRFMFDDEHAFTLHFAVRPESKDSCTLFVRVSRSVHKFAGPLGDLAYMLINELPLWEDRYIVKNADPDTWSTNRLSGDDHFLKGYRQYMIQNHEDLLAFYVR